jgi:hypothetical protein
MRSAFRKGVELLSERCEPESDTVRSQGQSSGSLRECTSEDLEGIGVPKNATQLKPFINKLMRKVIIIVILPIPANAVQDLPRGPGSEWIAKAKEHIEHLQREVSDEKEWLGGLLAELEQGAANMFQEELNRDSEEN